MVGRIGVALVALATAVAALFLGPLKPERTSASAVDPVVCQQQVDDYRQAPKRLRSGDTRAVLIGDSWSTGAGVFPRELARAAHLDLRVAAVGGTGYLNPGACGGREFASRVWEVPQDTELVVLAGGVNDAHAPDDLLRAAVTTMMESVHLRAPSARIVVLGVPRIGLLDDDVTGQVDSVIAEAAGDAFVDVRDWDISLLPDRIHPDAAGAGVYAGVVAEALAR